MEGLTFFGVRFRISLENSCLFVDLEPDFDLDLDVLVADRFSGASYL